MFQVAISPKNNEISSLLSGGLSAGVAMISIRNFAEGLPVERPSGILRWLTARRSTR